MFLVDTDVCVDVLRGNRDVVESLAALESEGPLALSAVTVHELWEGAARARDPGAAGAAIGRFLEAFDVLAYDDVTARVGGGLAAGLRARGRPIGDLDTMIAAAALHAGATLVTRNARHFQRIPGLSVRAP